MSTRRARAAARFASSDLRSVRGKTAGELQSPRSRWPFGAAVFALCLLAAANERPTYRRQAQRIRFILGLYRNDGPTGEVWPVALSGTIALNEQVETACRFDLSVSAFGQYNFRNCRVPP